MSADFIFGFHPVRELLRHRPGDVEEVWCAAKPGKRRAGVEELCARHGIAMNIVAADRIALRGGGQHHGQHNGFGAVVRLAEEPAKQTVVDPGFVVLAEDLQDPRNLGALLRVCESAGVARVLIRDRGSAPLTPVAVKTSAGASEWLQIDRVTNSAQEIEALKAAGYWVYGADASGVPPWQVDLTGNVVICMGGEASGLRARTRGLCDELVGLPMRGQVESLNVSTAASALLYEAVRQRLAASDSDGS